MFKKRLLQILVIGALMLLSIPPASAAETPIQVETDKAILNLPGGINFSLSVESTAEIKNITLLYGTSERTCHEELSRQEITIDPDKKLDVNWLLDFKKSDVLPPGVQLWWQWEITDASGNSLQTEKKTLTVEDQRHPWFSKTNKNLTVNWYKGSESFGSKLLSIASNGMRRLESDMGIQFTEPITLTIYPTSSEMQEVMVYSQQWAGGVAFSKFNIILLTISPDELAWAQNSLPHELSHLVVEARIDNCLGATIPTWLNEGLAVFAEGKISSIYNQTVMQALMADELPSLNSLSNGFPAYSKEATLAYAQSGMIVDYLITEYGPEKMDALLTNIQNGGMIDKALREVYGFDTGELDSAWRQSQGFSALYANATPEIAVTRTSIPTLALWTAPVRASSTPILQPTAISPTVQSTVLLTSTAEPTPLPEITPNNNRRLMVLIGSGIFLGLILVILGSVSIFIRRRRA
jgi:hypothetical protein